MLLLLVGVFPVKEVDTTGEGDSFVGALLAKIVDDQSVPQQENPYDCGVYVLMYIEHFIKHAPNRMKTEYLTMFGEKCFGIKEVCALRRRIQSLIKEFLKRVPGNDSIPRNKQNLEDKVDKISRKRNMDNNRETNEESSKNVEQSNKKSKNTKVKFKDVKEVDDVKLRQSIRVKKPSYKLLT
ncbi:ubiquitin-like-specific protease 1D [Tanacetum coccineum]